MPEEQRRKQDEHTKYEPPGSNETSRRLSKHEQMNPGRENSRVPLSKLIRERVGELTLKRKREDHSTKHGWPKWNQTAKGNGLERGENLLMQNMKSRQWNEEAIVIAENQDGMSYEVEINGKIHTRNRRFLQKLTGQENPRQIQMMGEVGDVVESTITISRRIKTDRKGTETSAELRPESKLRTVLSNEMTNEEKLAWFAAFGNCLEI